MDLPSCGILLVGNQDSQTHPDMLQCEIVSGGEFTQLITLTVINPILVQVLPERRGGCLLLTILKLRS